MTEPPAAFVIAYVIWTRTPNGWDFCGTETNEQDVRRRIAQYAFWGTIACVTAEGQWIDPATRPASSVGA